MADLRLKLDPNGRNILGAIDDSTGDIVPLYVDHATGDLNVSASVSLAKDDVPAASLTQAVAVQIVDGSGDQITSFGGGTQYTEDVAAAADPVGNALILIRDDALSGQTTADGDNVAVRGTDKGEMYVKHTDSIPITDNSGSLTVDAPAGTPVFVRLSDGASAVDTIPVSLASVPSHAVTNAGTFLVQENGSALTALQLIDNLVLTEDLAAQSGDPGVQMLALRATSPANTSGAAGDYEPLQVNGGRLWVSAALEAGTNTNEVVGDVAQDAAIAGNPLSMGGRASTAVPTAMSADGDSVYLWLTRNGAAVVSGGLAHDAANNTALSPVKVGSYASSTNRTRVASGDVTDFLSDLAGRQIANLGQVRELRKKQTTTISSSTSETTIVTAAASTFNDLVALIISNTSGTAARVDIRDTTAGSVLFSLYIPAGDMRGFSLPGVSIPQTTVNTNWTAQSSASVADLRVFAIYEQNT